MKFHPLPNYIFIKRDAAESTSKGGIVITKEHTEISNKGIVIGTGSAIAEVKEGDRVLFKTYNPDEVSIEGEEYAVAKENDILAILL